MTIILWFYIDIMGIRVGNEKQKMDLSGKG